MTTARDLIQSSLRLLRVVADEETMTASQAKDGLEVLNDMLHALKAEGADLGFADIESTDEMPLPREHIRPVRFLLAVDLAAEFASTLTPEVATTAQRARGLLQAAYRTVGKLTSDIALQDRRSRYLYDNRILENGG